jgi:5-(carboxyamino)imidazole ribonucleotide mutase
VLIAAAGGAAHLPGVVAAWSVLPVIGVPMSGGALGGLDALLSMAQMPAGIPVATVAIGEAGARNAAHLAMAILALNDSAARDKLVKRREANREVKPA